MQGSRISRGLVDLEEEELWLGDDGIIRRLEVLEELLHVFRVNIDSDVQTEARNWRHVELWWRGCKMKE